MARTSKKRRSCDFLCTHLCQAARAAERKNSDLSAGTLADRTSSRASPRESEPIVRCKSPRAAHASP